MLKKFCDSCGKEIINKGMVKVFVPDKGDVDMPNPDNDKSYFITVRSHQPPYINESNEFCEVCYKKLENVIKGLKK